MTSQFNYAPVYHNNSEWPTHIWAIRLSDGETRCYVEQQTCRDDNLGGLFVCSECGANVSDTYVGMSYIDDFGKRWYAPSNEHWFRYCPNCGAKVVSE